MNVRTLKIQVRLGLVGTGRNNNCLLYVRKQQMWSFKFVEFAVSASRPITSDHYHLLITHPISSGGRHRFLYGCRTRPYLSLPNIKEVMITIK